MFYNVLGFKELCFITQGMGIIDYLSIEEIDLIGYNYQKYLKFEKN